MAFLPKTPWGSVGLSWATRAVWWAAQRGKRGRELGCGPGERERRVLSLFFSTKTVFLYFVSNFFCYLKLFWIFKLSKVFKYHMDFLKKKCHVGLV
jgi:hypothetical protein